MSTHKYIDKICVLVTVFTLLLTILFMNGRSLGISDIVSEDAQSDMFTQNDLNADWDTSGASQIMLSDDGSIVKGNGAYVYDGDVYIVYAGKYVLSGELSNGTVIINADGDDKIWLMLNGVSIHCDDDAALRIEQADKVFLTLADDTENTLSSGGQYRSEIADTGVDGVIYARDDLTINGNGALSVTAEYRHGIVCNDDLVIAGGDITVDAAQDAFHANDSIRVREADISICAGDDGMTVSNDEQTAYLYIESGNIDISSCYEGLEAIAITIAGGTIDITPTDDGINASGSGAGAGIRITGGEITIVNPDGADADGLDSNRDIEISGGSIFISVSYNGSSAIDYGSENGGVCEISGGTVIACGSSAMAEGFASSSAQGFLMYQTSAAAGTAVSLERADGGEILCAEIPCSFSSIVISAPEMAVGDTCMITVGDTKEEITIDNSSNTSGFGGGMHGGNGGMFGGRPGGNTPPNMTNDSDGRGFGDVPDNGQGTAPQVPDSAAFENGGQMPEKPGDFDNTDLPDNGQMATPPTRPDGAGTTEGEQRPDAPDGENDSGMPNDFSQRNDKFSGMQRPDDKGKTDAVRGEPDSVPTESAGNALSGEQIVLLSVSSVVLILGCGIAFMFKCRS